MGELGWIPPRRQMETNGQVRHAAAERIKKATGPLKTYLIVSKLYFMVIDERHKLVMVISCCSSTVHCPSEFIQQFTTVINLPYK